MRETQALELEALLRDEHGDPDRRFGALRETLARAPDPDEARKEAVRLLEAPFGDGRRLFDVVTQEAGPDRIALLGRVLHAVCGVAPFLAPHLRRHPAWLLELLDDDLGRPLDAGRSRCALEEGLRTDPDPVAVLRRHKYRELARITIRDADAQWVPLRDSAITLADVSTLADLLLEHALDVAGRALREQLGPPVWRTARGEPVALSFTVLGLGKLGSGELNYSSDVDLIYVYDAPPSALDDAGSDVEGIAKVAPADYFTRLAQAFGRLVTSSTIDGFLYRIDLDLRPEGAQGAMVTSTDALETYYEAWADTWERAAFMKARPVAGDLDLGWRIIRQLAPMIYQSTMDYAAVESIRSLKQNVEDRHGRSDAGFNVKIDSGGIRDVEFVAQALQLLHGGRIPQVRERSTQGALANLCDVGLLPAADTRRLLDAYRLLRRVENRLQMEAEKQRHVLPDRDAERQWIARAMGFTGDDALAELDAAVEGAREGVQAILGATFAGDGRDRILDLFLRHAFRLAAQPGMRALIEDLAAHFARCIDALPEPELALNNLDRFLDAVGTRRFYYELLLDRPEIVDRLTALFSASRFLSNYLASHPRLIEPVFADASVLLLSRDELAADCRSTRAAAGDSDEAVLDALRIFQHRQVLNVGLLDLAGKIKRADAEAALSEIAEVCLESALELAEAQLERSRDGVPDAARRGSYLVVGMGKLGSHELGYGSDLDLIFLYDLAPGDREAAAFVQHHFVRLTQRLISTLQTATAEGSCYEIDARLRPSGNQGTLVTSLDAFERYHAGSAAVWERQALLRARPVAGSGALAARFTALRREILERPLPADAITEVDEIRKRMEAELAHETGARRNFKTGRGGLLDVETIVQLVQLRHGVRHPELLEPARLEHHLDRIESHALLEADDVQVLRSGWEFLQNLASRLRIVENRSISDLDAERGDLESLARHVGYEAGSREGGARRALLRDYRRHTEAIRSVYDRFVERARPTAV